MPENETITSYAGRLIEPAERVVVAGGGRRMIVHGLPVYEIVTEARSEATMTTTGDQGT